MACSRSDASTWAVELSQNGKNKLRTYVKAPNGDLVVQNLGTEKFTPKNYLAKLKDNFRSILLPVGYPQSVAPEYIWFQLWDTSQEACGYFRGLLSTQAWMTGIGVGAENVSPLAAVFNTMIVDYSKMLFGLFFASRQHWLFYFSSDQKFWQVGVEVLRFVEAAMLINIAAFPRYFLHISILGGMFGSVACVINGCSRAPLIAHLARANNFSDCNAKEGNQSRMLKMFVIGLGYKFLIFVNSDPLYVTFAFLCLSVAKVYSLYMSMKVLALRTLNDQRLDLCLKGFLKSEEEGKENEPVCDPLPSLSPQAIAKQEKVWFPLQRMFRGGRASSSVVKFGVSLESLLSTVSSTERLEGLVKMHETEGHVLAVDENRGKHGHRIAVAFKQGATEKDVILAHMHVRYFQMMAGEEGGDVSVAMKATESSLKKARGASKKFVRLLEQLDWSINQGPLLITTGPRRIQFAC